MFTSCNKTFPQVYQCRRVLRFLLVFVKHFYQALMLAFFYSCNRLLHICVLYTCSTARHDTFYTFTRVVGFLLWRSLPSRWTPHPVCLALYLSNTKGLLLRWLLTVTCSGSSLIMTVVSWVITDSDMFSHRLDCDSCQRLPEWLSMVTLVTAVNCASLLQ